MSGTQRQDHERADAYDVGRNAVNVLLRKYRRRLVAANDAYVDEKYQEATAAGLPFDADHVGWEAFKHATSMYLSQEQIEAAVVEELPDAEA